MCVTAHRSTAALISVLTVEVVHERENSARTAWLMAFTGGLSIVTIAIHRGIHSYQRRHVVLPCSGGVVSSTQRVVQ